MAGFLNVRRRYSAHLRSGVAQGLALLGSLEGEHLANGATGSDEASTVVRELLAKAGADESGRTWQSLSDVLPLIAEASPDEFLDAVRADLDRSNPLLATMFGDSENAHWFSTSSPHTGLLRALEGLAWSPRWILDASLALARLDAVDPGGRLANRPLDSLSSIFPHWIRHTSAPLETRIKAVELISRQVPETAWHLTHRILPTDHATSWPPHAPRFRDWKPESQSVSITEGLEYISAVVTVALELAGDHPDRWADLAEHLAALPPEDRERVLAFLERKAQVALPDADRLAAWDRLRAEIARHRRFPSAEWSMDEETLGRLEKVTAQLEPGNESARLSYLFGWHPDVPGVDQTDATYEAEVTRLRHDAVRTVLETEGFDGLISVSARASAPHLLGVTVADVGGQDVASEAIAWLDADDAKPRDVALAWAARSVDLRGLDWLLQTLETPEASTSERKLGLLLAAPPGQPLWDVIEVRHSDLLDAYWRRMSPWRVDRADVERAAGELAFRERAWSAIDMLAMDLHQYKEGSESPAPDLVLEVVEKATETDPHESGLLIGQDAARP